MKQKLFIQQYKDPRWQKKRLEIMERDNFFCTSCGDSESTLNVHHCVPYKKDCLIWEYENNELTTLCEDCHKEISESIEYCKLIIYDMCRWTSGSCETKLILDEICDMNPFELQSVRRLIQIAKIL